MLHTDRPTACQIVDPELWFSKIKKDQEMAKTLCRNCMVKLDCLADALETEKLMGQQLHGIHGGLTPAERKNIQVRRIA